MRQESDASEVEVLVGEGEAYRDDEDAAVSSLSGWRIQSLEGVEFALRRLGELRREAKQNEGLLKSLIAGLKLRHTTLNAKVQRGINFFEGHLRLYAEANRSALLGTGKKKSRDLHHGSIGWRTKGQSIEVKDEAAFLAWCKRLGPEFVRTKEEPVLAAVKEHVAETGEVPEGAEVVAAVDEFQVKTEVES